MSIPVKDFSKCLDMVVHLARNGNIEDLKNKKTIVCYLLRESCINPRSVFYSSENKELSANWNGLIDIEPASSLPNSS
jgi:hypothetical protein